MCGCVMEIPVSERMQRSKEFYYTETKKKNIVKRVEKQVDVYRSSESAVVKCECACVCTSIFDYRQYTTCNQKMRLKRRKLYRIAAFYKQVIGNFFKMCVFGLAAQFNQQTRYVYLQSSLSNTLKNAYFYPYGINSLSNHSSTSA